MMRDRVLDAIIIGDPSNVNWLCGYDAWSFYTPQMMLFDLDQGPFWMRCEMDAGVARSTTYLKAGQIIPYPETLVQRPNTYPEVFLADSMEKAGSPAANLMARLWTNEMSDVLSFGADGGHYQAAGIETMVFGLGSMAQIHQPDEFIEVMALADGLGFLDRLLTYMKARFNRDRQCSFAIF